jgi:hypothetical protein
VTINSDTRGVLLEYLKFTNKKLKEDSEDHCQVLPAVILT